MEATLPTLPVELLLAILSYIPSKRTLQSLSLTCTNLRAVCAPHLFDSITVSSVARLHRFLEDGDGVGRYVKRLVLRWDSFGIVLSVEEQGDHSQMHEMIKLATRAMEHTPGVRTLVMDFPGSLHAMSTILKEQGRHTALQSITLRNGRWEHAGSIDELVQRLGQLRGLTSLSISGMSNSLPKAEVDTHMRDVRLPAGAFTALTSLDISSVSTLDDTLLAAVVASAATIRTLAVRSCPSVTLAGTRRLLTAHGSKLHNLSLEIVKMRTRAGDNDEGEEEGDKESRHELNNLTEDEHLCPVIRDCCPDLRMLDLYTNRICGEVFATPTATLSALEAGNGVMAGGLPTPPGSPNLAPTRAGGLPVCTPPTDASAGTVIATDEEISEGTILPPPLYNFANYRVGVAHPYAKLVDEPLPPRRQAMKRVALRIPYDASCFGAGAGGPSVQQRYTRLCDGGAAGELLEVGQRAFEEGIAEVVSVRGHWKGGPYLIMAD